MSSFDPNAALASLSLEEKIALLAGTDMWRTIALPNKQISYMYNGSIYATYMMHPKDLTKLFPRLYS